MKRMRCFDRPVLLVVFALACGFAGVNAVAGIRVIHGGGGYAEMMALSYFQQLDLLIKPCLRQAKACGLSEAEEKILGELLAVRAFRTDKYHLEFGGEVEGPVGHKFRLPLSRIYKSDGTPFSANDIAVNVLAAWLSQPDIVECLESLWSRDPLALAHRIFGEAKFDVETLFWKSATLRALNAENAFATLLLNDADVTQDVMSAVACREGSAFLKSMRGLHAEGELAIGRAYWTCGGTTFKGVLVLERHETGIRGRVLSKLSCAENLEAK